MATRAKSKKKNANPAPVDTLMQILALMQQWDDLEDDFAPRAQVAQETLVLVDTLREWAVSQRLVAVQGLSDVDHLSLSQVATLLNISKSRAQQLVDLNKAKSAPAKAAAAPVPYSRKGGVKPEAAVAEDAPAPRKRAAKRLSVAS